MRSRPSVTNKDVSSVTTFSRSGQPCGRCPSIGELSPNNGLSYRCSAAGLRDEPTRRGSGGLTPRQRCGAAEGAETSGRGACYRKQLREIQKSPWLRCFSQVVRRPPESRVAGPRFRPRSGPGLVSGPPLRTPPTLFSLLVSWNARAARVRLQPIIAILLCPLVAASPWPIGCCAVV